MPLQATSGAASYDAFGGGVPVVPQYIEEVFSTWLYTGNNTSQTITNGIDLSTKGGLVWMKKRNTAFSHALFDTARGINYGLSTDATNGNIDYAGTGISSFNTTGFSLGSDSAVNNGSMASWTFRKQPKFFDIVTYTGDGTSNKSIAHNLGSVPGCVIIKLTSAAGSGWETWHRGSNAQFANGGITGLSLNTTGAGYTTYNYGGTVSIMAAQPTSTNIFVKNPSFDSSACNASGQSYVAYLFAHDAGGFGLTGTDNVISCGSYIGSNTVQTSVSLGYEPQFVLTKNTTTAGNNWAMFDNMRGVATGGIDAQLIPNSSGAEVNTTDWLSFTSTGFQLIPLNNGTVNRDANTYIYIAIRRGPMKVPTSGTSVFGLNARTGTGAIATVTGGQTDDAVLVKNRGSAVASLFSSRLTGTGYLVTSSTAAEVAAGTTILQANPWDVMDGVKIGTTSTITNASANTYINYLFKRAPSFFDEVCYTGAGSGTAVSHNLGVAPEIVIVKSRDTAATNWETSVIVSGTTYALTLDRTTNAGGTAPTSAVSSTTFTTTAVSGVSARTYVAYLFATLAGVSKVGSYTGTAALLTVACGFTTGARFILIKRTDTTGDWYVYDSARGISSSTDPYFFTNTTAAEVTGTNYVDTDSTGFKVTAAAPAELNASGGTFIFLAIA